MPPVRRSVIECASTSHPGPSRPDGGIDNCGLLPATSGQFFDVPGRFERHVDEGSAVARANVRADDHVIERQKRMVGIWRLLHQHIDRRAGEVSRLERGYQIVLDHESAPRGVNEDCSWFHGGDRFAIDQTLGFSTHRQVQRHEVGSRKQREQVGQLDPKLRPRNPRHMDRARLRSS